MHRTSVKRLGAAFAIAIAVIAVVVATATGAGTRARFDTRVLALIPSPGFPAKAYVAPNHRIYEGTYTNPNGDSIPSRGQGAAPAAHR